MSRSKFFDKIRVSTIERQVEDCYNEGISFYFKKQMEIQLSSLIHMLVMNYLWRRS